MCTCVVICIEMPRHPHLSMYKWERIKRMLTDGASTREVVENMQKEKYFCLSPNCMVIKTSHRPSWNHQKATKVWMSNKTYHSCIATNENTMNKHDEMTAKELQLALVINNGVSVCTKMTWMPHHTHSMVETPIRPHSEDKPSLSSCTLCASGNSNTKWNSLYQTSMKRSLQKLQWSWCRGCNFFTAIFNR